MKQQFKQYLSKQLTEKSVNSYMSGLNHLSSDYGRDLLEITDVELIGEIKSLYGIGGEKRDIGNYGNGGARNAIIKYHNFVSGEHPRPNLPHEPLVLSPINKNSRYRGNHIGNAQNLFIRNILSSLGIESFNEEDWKSTKDYFLHKCAYCGAETELLIEHVVPINKDKLGEHRLGNLVPSCKPCNSKKGNQSFREFLKENTVAINRIEEYMDSKNYVPLEDNEQMKMILNMAHNEVSALADRYITIINELFSQK